MDKLLYRDSILKIPTGFSLDRILRGGIETKTITQIYGEPAVGKTNLCLQILVNCIKIGKKAVFIDTEGGFSLERLKQIAGEKFRRVVEGTKFYEVTNFEEQNFLIENLEKIVDRNYGLIVVDSFVSLYRIFSEEEKLSNFNRILSKQLAKLSEISRKKNLAVVVTNQVYSYDNEIEPVGGNILKYWSKVIMEIKRKGRIREIILRRHKYLPENLSTHFIITERGIFDV